jgi:thiamine biosynthesis lipoprotein
MITTEAPVLRRRAWVKQIMGLPVSVHVRCADPSRPEVEAAVGRVFAHLRRADAVFSTWRADSDLLRLQHHEAAADDLHPWVGQVVELCLEAEERTEGLFQAWRHRPEGRTVFDPTGLVKGWAVAGAAAHLETVEEIVWCIGAGGDIVTGVGRGMHDLDPGRAPVWRIGIENPRDRAEIAEVVTLTTGAIATSGAAARGAHITDPRTGAALDRDGSASIVGPDLLWADVWATAAFVAPGEVARLLPVRDAAYRLITH